MKTKVPVTYSVQFVILSGYLMYTDGQTNRQKLTRQIDTHTDRYMERQTNRNADRRTMDIQMDGQTKTDRWRDK